MKITDRESWLEAERHYRQLRLYNTIYMNWAKSMNVPTLFSWSAGIVLLLYVTFRPSGLPFLVYIWFPPVAVVSMFIITWLCYDAVVAKRVADEAMEKLQSRTGPYFKRLSRIEKLEVMRRDSSSSAGVHSLGRVCRGHFGCTHKRVGRSDQSSSLSPFTLT